MSKRYITPQDVADQFGVSRRTVEKWISAGILPAYKIGPRAVRLDPDEVDAALKEPMPVRDELAGAGA